MIRANRRGVHSDEESEQSDDEDGESLYSFTPSYGSASENISHEMKHSKNIATPSLALFDITAPASKFKVIHVYESKYTGDELPEWHHMSNLTLLHEPCGSSTLCLDEQVMILGSFSNQVVNISSPTTPEKNSLAKLLRDVKHRTIGRKKTIWGTHQYVTPGVVMRVLESNEKNKPPTSPRSLYCPHANASRLLPTPEGTRYAAGGTTSGWCSSRTPFPHLRCGPL
ncbi:uncharacterized protein LY79DRAFT_191767 [Colletotrichum navitas]|uniref:Uncharacterized protein n=1 Tax=Colletotrichum navitas TaxID=681940 RepID=A0AAD8PIX9_9PEZI|nr:uncharacterized protein LY79DRAFT_191767 [Colletotrichum navitas]KAK1561564.1 hypothetical protein LY79DRAFT_191767 [Colletotrichum navitas]